MTAVQETKSGSMLVLGASGGSIGPMRRALVLMVVCLGCSSGCVGSGASPDCPELPATDDPSDPAFQDWRAEAEALGCVSPLGSALEPGSGGSSAN